MNETGKKNNVLKSEAISNTIELLHRRITERFPESGLASVCKQLHEIACNTTERAAWIEKPVEWLRVVVWCVSVLIVLVTIGAFAFLKREDSFNTVGHFFPMLEAVMNVVVLIGAAIFFLLTLEVRLKRQRALNALHELRSVAHVIDMHQLTKDPEKIITKGNRTDSSPKMLMTQFQLRRYLDYCSEMLSLTGKVAAVYVQHFDDGVALSSASEVETLTTGLSRKIWQKILILHTFDEESETSSKSPLKVSRPEEDQQT